jgi:hypothetical protein
MEKRPGRGSSTAPATNGMAQNEESNPDAPEMLIG